MPPHNVQQGSRRRATGRASGSRGAVSVLARYGVVLCIALWTVASSLVATSAEWKPEEQPFPALPELPQPERLAILSEAAFPKGRGYYLALLTREAEAFGLPPAVADAVAQVESGYNPSAFGKVGEFGLMQVRSATAAMLGHKGLPSELFRPETNVRYGVTYLAKAWGLAKGDLCRTLMKYRAGHGEERMTPLSVDYCRRARNHLAAIGSPLANSALPLPSFFSPIAAARTARDPSAPSVTGAILPVGGVKVTSPPMPDPAQARRLAERQRLWAEHVVRVRNIETKIDRVMAGSR